MEDSPINQSGASPAWFVVSGCLENKDLSRKFSNWSTEVSYDPKMQSFKFVLLH